MASGKIIHGLHASLCRSICYNLLRTAPLTLSGKLTHCLYVEPIQWWGVGPSRAPHPSPLVFLNLRYWGSSWMICGFHTGSSRIGRTYCLPPILATGGVGNLFGLCPLFCLYPHGDGIGWISLWGPGTLIHNPVGFPAGITGPHPGLLWMWPGCCCCVPLLLVSIWRRKPGDVTIWMLSWWVVLWFSLAMTCLIFVVDPA